MLESQFDLIMNEWLCTRVPRWHTVHPQHLFNQMKHFLPVALHLSHCGIWSLSRSVALIVKSFLSHSPELGWMTTILSLFTSCDLHSLSFPVDWTIPSFLWCWRWTAAARCYLIAESIRFATSLQYLLYIYRQDPQNIAPPSGSVFFQSHCIPYAHEALSLSSNPIKVLKPQTLVSKGKRRRRRSCSWLDRSETMAFSNET